MFFCQAVLLFPTAIQAANLYGLMKTQFRSQPLVLRKNLLLQVMQTEQSGFLTMKKEQKPLALLRGEAITG